MLIKVEVINHVKDVLIELHAGILIVSASSKKIREHLKLYWSHCLRVRLHTSLYLVELIKIISPAKKAKREAEAVVRRESKLAKREAKAEVRRKRKNKRRKTQWVAESRFGVCGILSARFF